MSQQITFSALANAAAYPAVKTAYELAYANDCGLTTGSGAAMKIATGTTVASSAVRRGTVVTFKLVTTVADVAAVTTLQAALPTATSFVTALSTVKTAKSYNLIVPKMSTLTVAAAITTASANDHVPSKPNAISSCSSAFSSQSLLAALATLAAHVAMHLA
jgi:hypothetical protein